MESVTKGVDCDEFRGDNQPPPETQPPVSHGYMGQIGGPMLGEYEATA